MSKVVFQRSSVQTFADDFLTSGSRTKSFEQPKVHCKISNRSMVESYKFHHMISEILLK